MRTKKGLITPLQIVTERRKSEIGSLKTQLSREGKAKEKGSGRAFFIEIFIKDHDSARSSSWIYEICAWRSVGIINNYEMPRGYASQKKVEVEVKLLMTHVELIRIQPIKLYHEVFSISRPNVLALTTSLSCVFWVLLIDNNTFLSTFPELENKSNSQIALKLFHSITWLKECNLFILQTFRHGFPHNPTALAFDPVQKLLAIGDKYGSLRM